MSVVCYSPLASSSYRLDMASVVSRDGKVFPPGLCLPLLAVKRGRKYFFTGNEFELGAEGGRRGMSSWSFQRPKESFV